MSELNRATILGTGTMGPGMGAVLARAGLEVTLFDVKPEALERAAGHGRRGRGRARPSRGARQRRRLAAPTSPTSAAALDGAEHPGSRRSPSGSSSSSSCSARSRALLSDQAIIASNTSGIPITKIAAELAHPERVIGWHWSNPPHLIPMNEVINGERTAPAVTAAIEELTRRIGYHPVTLKKEVPGFVENRVLYAIMRECLALVDEGVIDVEGLDLNVQVGDRLQARGRSRRSSCSTWRASTSTRRRQLPQRRPLQRERHLGDRYRSARRRAVSGSNPAAASSTTRPSASRSSSSSAARRSWPCERRLS